MTAQEKKLEVFIDSLGLRYFKGREFTPYWSRVKNGVKNSIPAESLWPNIIRTLVVADELRHIAKSPLAVISSYRNPSYNQAVGGSVASYHMQFMALDLYPSSITAAKLHMLAKSLRGKKFKIGNDTFNFRGGIGKYSSFVHIDTRGTDADW